QQEQSAQASGNGGIVLTLPTAVLRLGPRQVGEAFVIPLAIGLLSGVFLEALITLQGVHVIMGPAFDLNEFGARGAVDTRQGLLDVVGVQRYRERAAGILFGIRSNVLYGFGPSGR